MPFEVCGVWTVDPPLRHDDRLAGSRIELFAISKLVAQPRAHEKSVLRVDARVATVVQGVHVRPQQEPVVQAMFPAGRKWSNMCRLQYRHNLVPGNRTLTRVSIENNGLKRALPESRGDEPRIAIYRSGPLPGAQPRIKLAAQKSLQQLLEVIPRRLHRKVVALALNYVGSEIRGRVCNAVRRKEHDVAYEDAPDGWIQAIWDRPASIVANPCSRLGEGRRAVRLSIEAPRLREAQRGKPAKEPATDNPVV